jgi:hypothetical protein
MKVRAREVTCLLAWLFTQEGPSVVLTGEVRGLGGSLLRAEGEHSEDDGPERPPTG